MDVNGYSALGRSLLIIGLTVAAIGLVFLLLDKIGGLPRLPGDVLIRKKNFTFYFPLGTSLLISLILTLLFWLIGRK